MKIDGVNVLISDPANPVKTLMQGFRDIKMQNLTRVIGITGKNGAGKTRFLSIINDLINHRNTIFRNFGIEHQKNLHTIESFRKDSIEDIDYDNSVYLENKKWKERTDEYIMSKNMDQIMFSNINYGNVSFIKSGMSEVDAYSDKPLNDVSDLFNHVQRIINRNWRATHQETKMTKIEIDTCNRKYNDSVNFFKKTFGYELDINNEYRATLNGILLSEFPFSDGERIILTASALSDLTEEKAKESIIFWDEPERNLHPDAMFSLIDGLLTKRPQSQLWIVTHSIALLSYLDSHPEGEVWFMDQGEIKRSGRIPERVLKTLMGRDDKCEALQNFVNSPARYALLRYAAECLVPPESVDTASTDPQLGQIRSIIQAMGEKISLLDYGAGKGRLMKILDPLDDKNIEIEYYAYDKYDNDKDHILKSMQSRDIDTENYINEESFLAKKNYGNLCIMSNVLHEISPKDWESVFAADGIIGNFLSENGYLLIVEDYHLPVGETAHDYGFILPDSDQLKILFSINSESPSDFVTSDANHAVGYSIEGRLKAHLIHRKFLDNVNDSTIKKCIEAVKNDALKNIKETRKNKGQKDYKEGIRHAFWTMQFANCSLFLDSPTEKNEP